MTEEYLIYFAKLIENEIGIIYENSNFFQLKNRLEQIAKALGFATVQDLYQSARVTQTTQMKQLLLDVATNNETSFFRDPKLFDALSATLLPRLLSQKSLDKSTDNSAINTLRIWSGACSSGQEAYSLAILLCELNALATTHVEIVCTDISSRTLERAKEGRYSALEVARGLSPQLLKKYFSTNVSSDMGQHGSQNASNDSSGDWRVGERTSRYDSI